MKKELYSFSPEKVNSKIETTKTGQVQGKTKRLKVGMLQLLNNYCANGWKNV